MRRKKLIIFGTGSFGKIAYTYFKNDSNYKPYAFTVEKQHMKSESFFNLPVVPFEKVEKFYSPKEYFMFIAVGPLGLNKFRTEIVQRAKAKKYKLASYISSKAFAWSKEPGKVEIGENCFIFEGNLIQPFVKIGNNVIIWSGNHIGHESIIEDNCFITSHVVISGFCKIGKNSFLGVNACIKDGVQIAEDCVIGMGAVVVKNTEKGKIYIGNPAKPMEGKSAYDIELK
jgi:sugar O-acyltransferase (sialic acid O-acetyltransferase NeuD family)